MSPSNEQEGSLIKCLREIIGLFDFTVGNILWCQNELRTQDNSSILLLLTIGKEMTGILSNIMEKLPNFNGGHEGHDNLEATWLASRHYG